MTMDANKIKIGLAGFGLDTYWAQFTGLKERLAGYQSQVAALLRDCGAEVVDAGMVDSHDAAERAGEKLSEEVIEALFVFIATYALSSTLLPIVQRLKKYVVMLNLQPVPAIDYAAINAMGDRGRMTGEWLAHCQACSSPEFACVLNRARIPYEIVTGYIGEERVASEIKEWVDAFGVVAGMRRNRLGILGHYYGGMLDVYTDTTMQSAVFGTHIEQLEMTELRAIRDGVGADAVSAKIDAFREAFNVDPACSASELERAARTSVALDELVRRHRLGALAYYYEGDADARDVDIVTSLIPGCTLLTGYGIPTAGECEVKNVQAMKIMSLLGAGGSFSEPYAMDFTDDVVLWGHDGPAHFSLAEERVGLVPLPVYHGKPGSGLSIQMTVRPGGVTLLSVCEGVDGVFLLAAEGEAVRGPVLEIGNTNSRYRFPCGARSFMDSWSKAGPSHHCAIGTGHVAGALAKVAHILDIKFVKVC